LLTEWLIEYNFKRPHESLKYQTPFDFFFQNKKCYLCTLPVQGTILMENKNLSSEIDKIWEDNKEEFESKLSNWLDALSYGNKFLHSAKKEFHCWGPLKAYVSTTKAKSSSRAVFSLRFFGQEIAHLIVKDKEVFIKIKGNEIKNDKGFDLSLPDGIYSWKGKEGQLVRKHFKELSFATQGIPNMIKQEHRIESKFISEMCKGSGKFGLNSLRIQPVLIANKFPLQIPLPISASTGLPKPGRGHIDILARHKLKNNKTNLSVWELKKPNTYKKVASQAYIYSITLLKVLRHSKRASEWFKLFGFKSRIPDSLVIEAVVAVSRNQEEKFNKELRSLKETSPLQIGDDSIRLVAAYYKEKSDSITLEKDPFLE